MRRQLLTALGILLTFTVLTGLAYPLVTTGVAQVAFNDKANGSLVEEDGTVVGSSLIAQAFTSPEYFHPRPSAAGDDGYDAMASSGTNYGPTNPELLDSIESLATAYRTENGLAADASVPVDAVTSSGSGLDPHISEENARLQAPRVASARGLAVDKVLDLVDDHTTSRALGVLGEPAVNVFELNLALDDAR